MDEEVPATDEVLAWRRRPPRAAGATTLSPVVRRLLHEHSLDPTRVRGSGTGGRITRADVLAAASVAALSGAVVTELDQDRRVPFSAARRAAARHLVASKRGAAHAHVMVECDYAAVERVRRPARLSYLPFVARAVIDALVEFPACNATVDGEEITSHEAVHLGIAVDLEHAELVVPVVRDAQTLRLRALAGHIADVAARARDHRLGPDDVAGGTFTITNPGPFGTIASVPVINVPQVAILAVDAVRPRLVAIQGPDGVDAIARRPVGVLSLGFDARAVDLATAAGFVTRVRDFVETRDWRSEL